MQVSASTRAAPSIETAGGAAELVAPLHEWLRHPGTSELAKRLWGAVPRGFRLGLPRRLGAPGLAAWLRRDDLLIELVRVPQTGAQRAGLLLSQTDAARMVDHLLGGDGQIGRVLELQEAETGVLAYGVGRALGELGLPYQVADVRPARAGEPAFAEPEGVAWPCLLETALGAIDLRLVLTCAAARSHTRRYALELVLHDGVAASDLARLEPGDLLVSDRWALTPTAAGLEGPIALRVPGCPERLAAQLSQGALRVLGAPGEPPLPDGVDLVLARACVSLPELAAITAGAPYATSAPSDPVELWRGSECLVRGSLVVHRGALALRVAQSMR